MRRYLMLLSFALALCLLYAVTVVAGGPVPGSDPQPDRGWSRSAAPILSADVPITAALVSEDFESGDPPIGWSHHAGTEASEFSPWQITSLRAHGTTTYSMYHNDDFGEQDSWLVTAQITPTTVSELVFWQSENYVFAHHRHSLLISLGSGDPKDGQFTELLELGPAPDPGWEQVRVDLSSYAGQPIYLAWRYQSDPDGYNDEWYIDDVRVTAGLLVSYDGPKRPGETVTFQAVSPMGTNVSYTWDLDGGVIRYGAVVTRIYGVAGTYTAVLTASNSAGTVVETLPVLIGYPIHVPLVLQQ